MMVLHLHLLLLLRKRLLRLLLPEVRLGGLQRRLTQLLMLLGYLSLAASALLWHLRGLRLRRLVYLLMLLLLLLLLLLHTLHGHDTSTREAGPGLSTPTRAAPLRSGFRRRFFPFRFLRRRRWFDPPFESDGGGDEQSTKDLALNIARVAGIWCDHLMERTPNQPEQVVQEEQADVSG